MPQTTSLRKSPLLCRAPCKAGILDNAAHGERVHGVMPWDGQDPPVVGQDDVLALPGDVEPSLFERSHGPIPGILGMRYAGISASLRFC